MNTNVNYNKKVLLIKLIPCGQAVQVKGFNCARCVCLLYYYQLKPIMVRAHIIVSGIVQGVFFRFNTMKKAMECGVSGWVKNRRDGKVEVLCEGEEANVQRVVDWCMKGPEGSFVSKTEVTWEEYIGEFETFQITY